MKFVDEYRDVELAQKLAAFGWATHELDGHDLVSIDEAFESIPRHGGKPTCLIAHTVKGKGVSFMEDQLLWHYRSPNEEELGRAILELED